MYKILFSILFVFFISYVSAQEITVQILDKTNLQPIPNAVIVYKNLPDKSAVTNALGNVNIDSQQSFTIKALGYQTVKEVRFEGTEASKIVHTDQMSVGNVNGKIVFYLVEAINSLNEVVVSASRFEESRRDIAQQTQVLSKKEMAFLNQGSTADLLQQSGQVLVQKSQLGGGSPIIRGFEANKVLMVVDGIRMNNAIYRGGHLQNVITLDQAVLDRTEIVFGSGSVMYGSDALGGVMHFHTKKPIFEKKSGQAYLRYASAASEQVGHASWNVGFKNIAWVGGITYSIFNDLQTGNMRNDAYGDWGKRFKYAKRIDGVDTEVMQENTNLQTGSGYNQTDILQKVAIKINDNITNTVNFQYSTSSNINRYDRLSEISSGKLRFAEWYYGPQNRILLANHLDWKNLGFADLGKFTLAYQDIEESRHDRRFNTTDINRRTEKVKVYTANLDFTKGIKTHEIRYGFEFTYNNVNSTAYKENVITGVQAPQSTRYPDGGSSMRSMSVYAIHTWELGEKFIATQGLRYNNVNLKARFNEKTFFPFPFDNAEQNNQALNGNIGFIYMPINEWRFALSGATGFRTPNVDDMGRVFDSVTGSSTTTGNVVVPNPDIKPEKTTNLELSIRNKFFNMLTIEAIGFNTWYNDAITIQPFTLNGQSVINYNGFPANVVANQNARKAYIRGLYFNVVAELNSYVAFTSSFTYTYSRIKDETLGEIPLDHIPPAFGKSAFRINTKRVQTEIFALYNGWKRLQNYATFTGNEDNIQYATTFGTPSWVTFNVRTAYQFTPYTQLQVSLENIFDQHYRVFASGISGAGRNFIMTLRGTF
jgi:hemoglobin/transferrin/lactoferrin receptor protein